jgi:hypothetical protein
VEAARRDAGGRESEGPANTMGTWACNELSVDISSELSERLTRAASPDILGLCLLLSLTDHENMWSEGVENVPRVHPVESSDDLLYQLMMVPLTEVNERDRS